MVLRFMSKENADPQQAFRAGVRGRAYADYRASPGFGEEAASFAAGPNEAIAVATERVPGLEDVRAAYETGRALRVITKMFDYARAPGIVGEQFRDNLVAAVQTERMRRFSHWTAEDTIDMFMEMYARVLGVDDHAYGMVRDRLLEYAKRDVAQAPGDANGVRNFFRFQKRPKG